MKIDLLPEEQAIARYIGKLRSKRAEGYRKNEWGAQTQEERDINGFGAELAFCKIYNIMADYSTTPRKGGADCVLPGGDKVDVKCNYYENMPLMVKTTKQRGLIDRYALMSGNIEDGFTYHGWIYERELFIEDNWVDRGTHTNYEIKAKYLRTD